MSNNQSFKVGQKVVCVVNCTEAGRKMKPISVNEKLHVRYVERSPISLDWYCMFEEIVNKKGIYMEGYVEPMYPCSHFRALEDQYADITAELASKSITEERPDVVINEPVNN